MSSTNYPLLIQSGLFMTALALCLLCFSLMRSIPLPRKSIIFSFLLINIGVLISEWFLFYIPSPSKFFWLSIIICLSFLTAPILHRVAKEVIGTSSVTKKETSWQELTVIFFGYMLVIPLFLASQVLIDFKVSAAFGRFIHVTLSICVSLYVVQVIFYARKVILLINEHQVLIKECYANINQLSMVTLRLLLALVLLCLIANISKIFNVWFFNTNEALIIAVNLSVCVSFIACFYYWIHKRIYLANSTPIETQIREKQAPKYEKSKLSKEHQSRIVNKLSDDNLLTSVVVDSTLTLLSFAKQLGEKPQYISQVLNQCLDISFYDFVTQKRLDIVSENLLSNTNTNILEVAFQAGFNSKSTFNSAFKKRFDCTPSQYRRKFKANESRLHQM